LSAVHQITGKGGGLPKRELRACLLRDLAAQEVDRKVPTGTCPECEADVHVDTDADKGDVVSCEECGTDLEIVGLDPVELDIVEEDDDLEEEDEEDEY
jgi:alpha-aminoadipate carrier protein LysW